MKQVATPMIDSFRRQGATVFSYIILAILVIVNASIQNTFFSSFNLTSLLNNSLVLILVSMGQLFVVLTAGIDLSVGSIISLTNTFLATHLIGGTTEQIGVIVFALAMATIAGLVNGALIHYLNLQPILVTLATMSIYAGVALVFLPVPGGNVPTGLSGALTGQFIDVPVSFWVIVLLLAFWLWFRRTNVHLHILSLGSDETAALMNGIIPAVVRPLTYGLSGLFSGLAALFITAQTTSGDPNLGASYTLLSIAAVVIGGASLLGGRGNVWGVVSGSIILSIIGGLIYFAGISSFYQDLIQGLILLTAVAISSFRWSRSRRPLT